MQTVLIDEVDSRHWDDFVARTRAFSLMQSWTWGDVKEKLGWEAYRVAVTEAGQLAAAAQVLIKRLPLGLGSLAYVPRGPVGNWQDPDVTARLFDAVHAIARKNRAVMLKVEPAALDGPDVRRLFSDIGFRPSPYSNQPSALIILDITGGSAALLRNMRDSTRRHIRNAQRKGVIVRPGSVADIDVFYSLMRDTARRGGFTLRSREYYETEFRALDEAGQALMLLANEGDRTTGAHIAYAFGSHAAQFHLASSNESVVSPNHLLVWEQIKWAEARGCRSLDLGGIPDEIGQLMANGEQLPAERVDGLWGVWRFKRGFNKDITIYAGSFDYVYAPNRYALIARLSGGGRILESISSHMDVQTRARIR